MKTRMKQGVWADQAECRFFDTELFFSGDPTPAKRVCASCPVTAQCLEFALQAEVTGVWGGMTSRERNRLVRMVRRDHR